MPFLITRGLGSDGSSDSSLLVTMGLGDSGTVNAAACKALQVLAVQSFGDYLVVAFNRDIVVDGPGLLPGSWTVTLVSPAGAVPVTVTEVIPLGANQLRLNVNEQTLAALYRLNVPYAGLVDTLGNVVNAPYSATFFGYGFSPTVLMARAVDARILEIIFSENVVESDALDITNYSITPSVSVLRAEKVVDSIYRLHTTHQIELAPYQVDIENIRDLANNPVT